MGRPTAICLGSYIAQPLKSLSDEKSVDIVTSHAFEGASNLLQWALHLVGRTDLQSTA